jgi:LysM repeat protein
MMKLLVSVALAVSLLALVLAPVSAQACANPYTVKPGDNLYRIGVAFGIPWPNIAAFNNLANPNLIFAGQVLCIPPAGTVITPGPGTPSATATRPVTATVVPTATVAPTATRPVTATAVPTQAATPAPGFVIPTFSIIGVVRGTSVTIRTANFPANQTFTAMMGPIGTLGVGGTVVGTTPSGTGGVLTATYTIPAALANAGAIAIRLQSPSGYYSYNYFYNSNYTAP